MAKSCREYKKWVEEKVEKPIDEWVEKTEKNARRGNGTTLGDGYVG